MKPNYNISRHSDGSIWKAGKTIYGLCTAHNWATDPADYRSDHEHNRLNAYARAIRNRMHRLGFRIGIEYRELSSGIYWPKRLNTD